MKKRTLGICISLAMCLSSCSSLDLGWRAQKKGDYATAQTQSILALSQDPKNPDVYRLIAETALSKGETDRAAKAAEFARTLDGGSDKTERLLRKIYRQKGSHADLCDAGLRAVQKGYDIGQDESESFQTAYNAIAPSAQAYGCLRVAQAFGIAAQKTDDTKIAYIRRCIQKGKIQEAFQIADTIGDGSKRMPQKARLCFVAQEREEAAKILNAYADGDDGGPANGDAPHISSAADPSSSSAAHQSRIDEALQIFEEFLDWSHAADLMAKSEAYARSIRRVIALKRCFRSSEAAGVFEQYLEASDGAGADGASIAADIENLLQYGYSDEAWRVYERGYSRIPYGDRLNLATLFEDNALSSMAVQIVQQISEENKTDAEALKKVFLWHRSKGYSAKALAASDLLAENGDLGDAWTAYRLEVMADARMTAQFQTESQEWIETKAADKTFARRTVAKIEYNRKNYAAAIDLFGALDAQNAIAEDDAILYIDALSRYRQYQKLDDALSRYRPDIAPQTRAQYFENADAEVYYETSLQPLLSGSEADKIEARLLLARFGLTYKDDPENARNHIEKALDIAKSVQTQSYAYESIVSLCYATGYQDLAIIYAREFAESSPNDAKPQKLLAETLIKCQKFDEAAAPFDAYIKNSGDVYSGLKSVFELYSRYGHADEGLNWLETRAQNIKKASNPDDFGQYLDALTDAQKQTYIRTFSDEDLYRRTQAGYNELFSIGKDIYAVKAMYGFSAIRDWDNAAKVCRYIFGENNTVSGVDQGAARECLQVAVKSDAEADLFNHIIDKITSENDILKAAEILAGSEMLSRLGNKSESLLASKDFGTASRAYAYLKQIDVSSGDMTAYRRHMKEFEKQNPGGADVRLQLAYDAMNIGDFDAAAERLAALQSSRPDARDVIWAQIALARRAPQHKKAQELLEATIDGAQGVFHRLEWIAQGYAQFGDYASAADFAQKARDSGTLQTADFRRQMLDWFIASGTWRDREAQAKSHIAELKPTKEWRADRLLAFAKHAFEYGSSEIAQNAAAEAARLEPDNFSVKQYRLERAAESGDRGQMLLALGDALSADNADRAAIAQTLIEKNAYSDVIDVIDSASENGAYEDALSSILAILPQYADRRGIAQTIRTLNAYAAMAPNLSDEINRASAQLSLQSGAPCNAYPYVIGAEAPAVWHAFIVQCPEARDKALSALRSLRSELSASKRRSFDRRFAEIDASSGQIDDMLLDDIGISIDNCEKFRRYIAACNPIAAFEAFGQCQTDTDQAVEAARLLAAYGYRQEIGDLLNRRDIGLSDAQRAQIALIRIIAGDDSPENRQTVLRAPEALAKHDPSVVKAAVAPSDIVASLQSPPSDKIRDLLVIAAKSFNNSDDDGILYQAAQKLIAQSMRPASLWLAFAQALAETEAYGAAVKAFQTVQKLQPPSEFTERSLALAQAQNNDADGAWQSLKRGESLTASIQTYWKTARDDFADAPSETQKKINARLRELRPMQYAWLCDAAALALTDGDAAGAQSFALDAHRIGGAAADKALCKIYGDRGQSAQIPDEIAAGASAAARMAAAQKAYAQNNREKAISHWQSAFAQSSWSIGDFADAAHRLILLSIGGADPDAAGALEQLIALQADLWPHAAQPRIFRAARALSLGDTAGAEADSAALTRAQDRATLAAYAVLLDRADFAEKIIASDIKTATFDPAVYALAFPNVFGASALSRFCPETAGSRLQKAADFVVENLIHRLIFAKVPAASIAPLRDWANDIGHSRLSAAIALSDI